MLGAVLVALVMKGYTLRPRQQSLLMELPEYHWPNLRNLLIGLQERVMIFLSRVGGIILALMIVLWFLSSYPAPPDGASGPPIQYSFAGMLGRALEHVFAPIGFNWQISIALVPGLAAREVAVASLGTVYALSATADNVDQALTPMIAAGWSLATGLSLLAWYVFAPQCLSTLATVKRETNSWRYPGHHGGVSFRHGLCRVVRHVSHRAGAGRRVNVQQLIVTVLVAAAALFATWRLAGASGRRTAASHGGGRAALAAPGAGAGRAARTGRHARGGRLRQLRRCRRHRAPSAGSSPLSA